MSVRAYLGLGANLGDPAANLAAAVAALAVPGVRPRRRARLYRTAPLGPPGQPDYLNTAVEVDTALAPHALLAVAQAIEDRLGRVRTVRWGARTLDVDVLLFGDEVIRAPDLVVPHPELARRRFVLAPLADLAAERRVPGLGHTVGELLAALGADDGGCRVLDPEVQALDAGT
jgi:2-amino-4-hydroxy-6-hydroxymethyldihydropteridine diphosphokinase